MIMMTHNSKQIMLDVFIYRREIVILEICVCSALSGHCVDILCSAWYRELYASKKYKTN
jgi:hypothetical protein